MSDNAKNEGQYNPFEKMTFTYDKCFLCGEILTDENSTEEHIYPKWLQNKFDLWDKQLLRPKQSLSRKIVLSIYTLRL